MNIAELFVNLGIKGAEKTVGALGSVKKGLSEISSTSLEAKAGILAAVYGFEQMMARSGAMGTTLTNFAAATGLSSKTLQEWQYAARQAGVSGEELMGSVKGVQNSMTQMLLGKGAPEGLGIVSKTVGFDPKRARETFYVMEQLQKAAQALPKDVGRKVIESFGISEGVFAGMQRNKFTPEIMAKAPKYSSKEQTSLDSSNIAWANLGNKIEMAFGHFNAKHGGMIVGELAKVVDQVMKLAEAFERLAEKMKLLQLIGKAFEGWGMIFGEVTKTIENVEKEGLTARAKAVGGAYMDMAKGAMHSIGDAITPAPPAYTKHQERGPVVSTVNTTIHQHGVKDTHESVDKMKTHVNRAVRQNPNQRRGS